MTTKQEWTEKATKETSAIFNAEIEVTMKSSNEITIHSENKEAHSKAVELFKSTGAVEISSYEYEADEDFPVSWATNLEI